jgi:phosphate transport system permease protein
VSAAPQRTRRARRPRQYTSTDIVVTVACLISAVSFCWLVFTQLTGGVGWFGFLVASFVSFLVLLFVVNADRYDSSVAADRVVTAVVVTASITLFIPLASVIIFVIAKGLPALRLHFFYEDQRGVTPTMPATAGGGSHALVGTLEQVGLALLWSLPLGVACAIFLAESKSNWRKPVRVFVDAMIGLPSIMAGLFIYAVLILPYAHRISLFSFNGLMASLALSLTMVPTITRTVEVVLRLVPDGLREASEALGASRSRTVWSVVLPTASTGIATAVVLGIARVVGETAPLLLTAFGYDLMNADPTHGPQESLPLFVFRNIRKPNDAAIARGFAGALVLLMVVVVLFVIARIIGRDRSVQPRRRRAKRLSPGVAA